MVRTLALAKSPSMRVRETARDISLTLTHGPCMYSFCPPNVVPACIVSQCYPWAGVLPRKAGICPGSTLSGCSSSSILVMSKSVGFSSGLSVQVQFCVLYGSVRKTHPLILGQALCFPKVAVCVCARMCLHIPLLVHLLAPRPPWSWLRGCNTDTWLPSPSQGPLPSHRRLPQNSPLYQNSSGISTHASWLFNGQPNCPVQTNWMTKANINWTRHLSNHFMWSEP